MGMKQTADGRTRSLTITLPAGFEEFVRKIGEPALSWTLPPPSSEEPDIDRLNAASAGSNSEVLGPPGSW